YLRRPLLVTGDPGIGKSTLAYAVAHELRLGPVLRWPITSRSTRREGLYRYDVVGRIEDASAGEATDAGPGRYMRLGPLGTALARLAAIDTAHLGADAPRRRSDLIDAFLDRRELGGRATDQLLNAPYLTAYADGDDPASREQLAERIFQHLSPSG